MKMTTPGFLGLLISAQRRSYSKNELRYWQQLILSLLQMKSKQWNTYWKIAFSNGWLSIIVGKKRILIWLDLNEKQKLNCTVVFDKYLKSFNGFEIGIKQNCDY